MKTKSYEMALRIAKKLDAGLYDKDTEEEIRFMRTRCGQIYNLRRRVYDLANLTQDDELDEEDKDKDKEVERKKEV